MPAATGWNAARALIRQWRADPEAFAEPGELDPPCREACLTALHWIDDMQRDGRHYRMQPESVELWINGEVCISGVDQRAGIRWLMLFREAD